MIHCNDEQYDNGLQRRFRTPAIGTTWSTAIAIGLVAGLPAVATEIEQQPIGERTADNVTHLQIAQFAVPKAAPEGEAKEKEEAEEAVEEETGDAEKAEAPPPPPTLPQLPQRLTYEYGWGTESEIEYRTDSDLNDRLRDDFLLVTPEVNGFFTYRPTDWLEGLVDVTLEREFAVEEEKVVTLPNGDLQFEPRRRVSLRFDQIFFTLKDVVKPFDIIIGRRTFEDERHWVYDTDIDSVTVSARRTGTFWAEATFGREVAVDLDTAREKPDRINTSMLYAEYLEMEPIKLAGYAVYRDDRRRQEGRPLHVGLRSFGAPSQNFRYWAELAFLRGKDESRRDYLAHAFDVGGSIRLTSIPLKPIISLGYAFATGDDPNSTNNNEFRQTGLQSNEVRFAGIPEFIAYGEALDPELSNLRIFTAGLGFRPRRNLSIDFIYHTYRLNEIAEELRDSALTAELNQDETRLSTDLGSGFDIIVGVRSLFGIQRLQMDLRSGWFFPGDAFRIVDDDDNVREADQGFAIITKFFL